MNIALCNQPSDELKQQLNTLCAAVFETWDDNLSLKNGLFEKQDIAIFTVHNDEGKLIAFKIGYKHRLERNCFYSWLGAVDPDYRRQGLAKKLLDEMKNYCKDNSYKSLRTNSYNKFKPMLIMNLSAGFDILKTELNELGETKIIFEIKF